MRHRTISMLALTLALALAAGTALLAQDTSTSTGKITTADTSGGTITITTAAGSSETFSTDAQSMYMSNGRATNLRDLKVGDQVTITYRTSGNTRTVTHVDVVASNPTATASSGTSYNSGTDTYKAPSNDTYKPTSDTDNTNTGSTTGTNDDRSHMNATDTTDRSLPRTGSPLPMIALAAGLFGAAGLALAGLRRFAF